MKQYVLRNIQAPVSTKIDYKKELNVQQFEVVTKAEGPCLVLAGAGSGKTRTLVYRVAYLLEAGVDPRNILLVTFTNRAAHQMRDRIEALLGAVPKDVWWGTFHHIGNRTLRVYGKHIGIKSDFGILDEEDSATLLKSIVRSINVQDSKIFPRPKVLQAIISFSRNSKQKITDVLAAKYPDFLQFEAEINNIYGRYATKKKESNSLDYDDLLSEWLRLLKQSQEARDKQSVFFKYILVDEYQDTNRLQFEIIKILAGCHKNILVVGDDAQSIYSFRAADVNNILDFPNEFPATKIFKLEANYRSIPQILDLANDSINHNLKQYKKHLTASMSDGELPALIKAQDLNKQSAFVVQRVLELHQEGKALNNIAVLFRAHYQSAELELELIKRGIPYIMRGGIKFFEQAHIKDALSFLRIAQNPFDEIAWLRALTLQEGIAAGYADKIYQHFITEVHPVRNFIKQGSEIGISNGVKELKGIFKNEYWKFLPKRPAAGFANFSRTMKCVLDEAVFGNADKMIEAVLEDSYKRYCIASFDNSADRLDDLKELVNFSRTYKSVKQFLQDACLGESFKGETILEPANQSSEHLVLSTIHQAKGLEWDAVFLIGLVDNQFPHPKSEVDPVQMEEERRLFYVAVTRAKRQLYLLHPMTRYDYNYGTVIARPSQFVEELDSNCYEEWQIEQENMEEAMSWH